MKTYTLRLCVVIVVVATVVVVSAVCQLVVVVVGVAGKWSVRGRNEVDVVSADDVTLLGNI